MRPPGRAVLLAASAVVLRLALTSSPPRPDEVGHLVVTAHARRHGPFVCGDLRVDRPPLLVAVAAATLAQGYHQVHQVCGTRVALRDDAAR